MRRVWPFPIVGAVVGAAIFAIPWVLAQPLPLSSILTGNELVNITLSSGSGAQVTLAQVRNAAQILQTATASGTFTPANTTSSQVFTAALTGGVTLNTPLNPYDGEFLTVVNGTGAAFTQTITLTANPATTPAPTITGAAVATLAAGASAEWQYSQTTTTWYRLR